MYTLTITPNKEKKFTFGKFEKTALVSGIKIISLTDDCQNKVIARISYLDENGVPVKQEFLTLWEGNSYTSIGNWTQAQADSRILELVNATLL